MNKVAVFPADNKTQAHVLDATLEKCSQLMIRGSESELFTEIKQSILFVKQSIEELEKKDDTNLER